MTTTTRTLFFVAPCSCGNRNGKILCYQETDAWPPERVTYSGKIDCPHCAAQFKVSVLGRRQIWLYYGKATNPARFGAWLNDRSQKRPGGVNIAWTGRGTYLPPGDPEWQAELAMSEAEVAASDAYCAEVARTKRF